MVSIPEESTVPLHMEGLLETARQVTIVVDNARIPAYSVTAEYYRTMELRQFRRREHHLTFISSPVPRRQKLRVGSKSPNASPSGRFRTTARSSLQRPLPTTPPHWSKRKLSRWDNSSSDGDTSLVSESPIISRPKMPVRSWTQKNAHDSPSVPVRRSSLDLTLSKVIEDMQLVYLSDDEDQTSTTTTTSVSPGIFCAREDVHASRKHRMEFHQSIKQAVKTVPTLKNESTSDLLRRVIDDLKLYDESESNADADFEDD